MVKKVTDGFLDGGLDAIDGSTALNICSAEPTSIAECDSLSLIPAHTMAGGDFTKANGGSGGRKLTVALQADLVVDADGDATHVVINDGTDYYATTCTGKAVLIDDEVTVPAWDILFNDPT